MTDAPRRTSRSPRPASTAARTWSYDKAIHLVVDLGSLEKFPTNTIPGFTDNLVQMLPGLREHACSRGKRGGFVERLHEGTWLGHVAEHAALALQQVVGHDVRRANPGVKGQPGVYNVVFGYVDEQVGLAAARLAVTLVNHLVEADPSFDWDTELESFILRAERTAFGPSTRRSSTRPSPDIPWIRPNQHSLVQLGQGVHAKRIRATMTSRPARSRSTSPPTRTSPPGCWGRPACRSPSEESVRTADLAVGPPSGSVPRRREAARRQPRPRRLPGPAEREGGPRGVRDRRGVPSGGSSSSRWCWARTTAA